MNSTTGHCWLCGVNLDLQKSEKASDHFPPAFVDQRSNSSVTLGSLLILMLLACIAVGCWQYDPLLGFVYSALGVSTLAARYGAAIKAPGSPFDRFAVWLHRAKSGILVSILFVAILVISAMLFLFVVCVGS